MSPAEEYRLALQQEADEQERDRLQVELEAARGRVKASDEGFAAAQGLWRQEQRARQDAEQERDRLRADAVEVARALLDERGQVAAEPAAHRILAGSGEQPGYAPDHRPRNDGVTGRPFGPHEHPRGW